MRWNRLAALAGISYVLLAAVEFFGPGFPQTNDSAGALDNSFVDHRTWSLAAVVVQGLGNAVWIVFLCGLSLLLLRRASPASAAVAMVGGALNVAVSLAGLSAIAAIAFRVAGSGDPGVTRAFFEFAAATLVLSNFMLALMATAVAAARLSTWFTWASTATAVIFLLGGAAFARHGALSPDGTVQIATYIAELAWTLAASIILLKGTVAIAAEPIPAMA
jgi:hypothetical protein